MMFYFWNVFNATQTESSFLFYNLKYFPILNVIKYHLDYSWPPAKSLSILKHKTVIRSVSNFPSST